MKKLETEQMTEITGGDATEILLGIGCIGAAAGCIAAGPVGWAGFAALATMFSSCGALLYGG